MAGSIDVHNLFGSFRAEWLRDEIYQLFSEPTYFAHLTGNKSCVLMGGRGSGKTTALKCLSYEGQNALGRQDWATPTHVGIYYRINTNIVTAFCGPEIDDVEWRKLFGHFLNLIICGELARFLSWYLETCPNADFSSVSFDRVGRAFGFVNTNDLGCLSNSIDSGLQELELYINNIGGGRPTISQLQSPVSQFLGQLKNITEFEDVAFHIILDEYENLLDYQQQIVNTLIKHGDDNCFFKIGVRELGWRDHSTLNDSESLISPADYELIHIEDRIKENFSEFAKTVCESRFRESGLSDDNILALDQLLPRMTAQEEADALGVGKRVVAIRRQLSELPEYPEGLASVDDLPLYVFYMLNNKDPAGTAIDVQGFLDRDQRLIDKYQNHSYAMLFTIADKGSKITKYHCGHETFSRLAFRNIRFYMQLVHESIVQHTAAEKPLSEPIDYVHQTIAARNVGLQYLRELEGVTARGSHLTKLILGFGRFFQILAENPIGGSPEMNQFQIKETKEDLSGRRSEANDLLQTAVMHLALIRSPGTKLAAESDTRAWDYTPHPIFSPYFNYSTRRKRKISISESDLLAMYESPQSTIKRLLGRSRREHLADNRLPEQMRMFDDFFK